MDSLNKFYEMEEKYLKVEKSVKNFRKELDKFVAIQPNIQLLSEYYGSEEWFEHIKLENEGKISKNITTSVLGEDYAYETLSDIRNIAIEFLEIATEILK